jgi:hypothetical protein
MKLSNGTWAILIVVAGAAAYLIFRPSGQSGGTTTINNYPLSGLLGGWFGGQGSS